MTFLVTEWGKPFAELASRIGSELDATRPGCRIVRLTDYVRQRRDS